MTDIQKGVDDAEVTKKYLDALDLQLRYEGPGNVAAILMESIVGANGVILPPDGYMEGVRALCDKYGILLSVMRLWQDFIVQEKCLHL